MMTFNDDENVKAMRETARTVGLTSCCKTCAMST